jgi:hypothetical protein
MEISLAHSHETIADDADVRDPALIDWLLAGDASIRWQTLRDLCRAAPQEVETERQRVAAKGWGARLLAQQQPSGMWGGGLYGPKWTSTTYTMLTLRRLGLTPDNPQARAGCRLLLERGFYKDGGINYFRSLRTSEACVTGMVLSILAYFRYPDQRLEAIARHLLGRQMADGGWNCEDVKGATHSSFHTTLSVLEALEEYKRMAGDRGEGDQESEGAREPGDLIEAIEAAQARAHEFLLAHRLFRSHRSGEVVDGRMLRFAFPPRWRYDILRALDYLQGRRSEGGESDPLARDERLLDAIDVLRKKRLPDGRWPAYAGMTGRTYFEMEPAGQPGRWNTLRGLRVLRWWEAG